MDREPLTIYLENVTCIENLEDAVELSSDQLRALVKFESPVNLEEIKARMLKKPNMKIQIAACPAIGKVLIQNLCNNVREEEVILYFEDQRRCPSGGDVDKVKICDNNTSAVVQFQDSSVAERVVKVEHPYLGSDVELQLWSPLDDVDDLKAVPASHSAAAVVSPAVSSNSPDPVPHCVKKQSDPIRPTESLPDRSDGGKSPYGLEKMPSVHNPKPSVNNPQPKTGVQAMPSRSTPRQLASNLKSDVDSNHSKCLSVNADTEVQFKLLIQVLDSGFARDHRCTFTKDESNWTITLQSKSEESINILVEQLYGYKKNGTFEAEVHLSPGLARMLYDRNKQWLFDRLRTKVNEPAMLMMTRDGRLVAAALSQDTAVVGAEKLRACLLRGKVPLMEHHHKSSDSAAKLRKKLNEITRNRAVNVKIGAREITVDGLPCDVVSAVTEIDQFQCLYKP